VIKTQNKEYIFPFITYNLYSAWKYLLIKIPNKIIQAELMNAARLNPSRFSDNHPHPRSIDIDFVVSKENRLSRELRTSHQMIPLSSQILALAPVDFV